MPPEDVAPELPENIVELLEGYTLSQLPTAEQFAAFPDDRQREVLIDRRIDQDRAAAFFADAGATDLIDALAAEEARIMADPAYVTFAAGDPAWTSTDDKRDWHILTAREAMLKDARAGLLLSLS